MVDPIYVKQDIPGKGVGLVATQNIPKGTRILSESPTVTGLNNAPLPELQNYLVQQFDALSRQQQRDFLSLHNIHPYRDAVERYCGIYCTNALPLQKLNVFSEADRGGVFLDACRINHSCDEIAVANWNEDTEQMTVTASKDIPKDKEITINYLGVKARDHRKARRDTLQKDFNFICSCRLCSLPPKERKESDRQLKEITRMVDFVNGRTAESRWLYPLRELNEIDQTIRLYREQDTGIATLGSLFCHAAELTISYSDLARGKVFAERARSEWTTLFGSDCMEIKKWGYLADDPSRYEHYGRSTDWRTAIDDAPTGLDDKEFEDWLWRRERVYPLEQIVDLQCRAIFPTISGLPLSDNADYYHSNGNGGYRAKLHWCFLGEIKDLTKFGDSAMALEDIDGTEVKLAFFTEDGGKELPNTLVRIGYTVAIINAKRCTFPTENDGGEGGEGQIGIHHDDELLLKIFPISLRELLSLNGRVQEFSTVKKCHGCGKESASVEKCKGCTMFWYCDKACQAVGWKEKKHKNDCKILQDPDLRRMYLLDWDKYDVHIQFPLPAIDN